MLNTTIFKVVLCCALLSAFTVAYGQEQSVVAEGYLQSINRDGTVVLRLTNVQQQKLNPGMVRAVIPNEKYDRLYPGLRRFHTQRWLFTLDIDDTHTLLLISAYGLGSSNQDTTIVTPIPLATRPDKIIEDHSRATTHSFEQEVVELTNQERWSNGMLAPLKNVDLLHNSSDAHSEAMAIRNFFAHCDLDTKTSPGQRINAAGYSYLSAAENIAAGYSSPTAVMAGWMSSSGHRGNILSTSRYEFGVGYEYSGDTNADRFDNNPTNNPDCNADASGGPYYRYWTQNFGRRYNVFPLVIERELAVTSDPNVDLYIYGAGTATSMRFSNDGNNWSAWVTYTPDYNWQLSPGDGIKTVYSQISTGSNGSGTVYSANDQIELTGSCDPMVFSNTNLSGSQTYNSCEIIAEPNVTISGQIIFQAGSVTLGQNVEIPYNATLEVEIQ